MRAQHTNGEAQLQIEAPARMRIHTMSISLDTNKKEEQSEKGKANKNIKRCNVCCRVWWTIAQIIGFMFACVWIAFMVILIPQSMENIHNIITNACATHEWITFRSPYAARPIPESVIDCALNTTNIAVHFDLYLLLHFFRYYITAFIVRNRSLLWSLSILWEVFELIITTVDAFKMPYRECWWDSLFFDILLMNALGIELGLLSIKQMNKLVHKCTRHDGIILYDGFSNMKQLNAPYYVTPVVILFFYLIYMSELLNAFFIFIIVFWMYPVNSLSCLREMCFVLTGFFAVSQLYDLLCVERKANSGRTRFIWRIHWIVIIHVLIALEFTIILKAYSTL
eukprot:1003296_1